MRTRVSIFVLALLICLMGCGSETAVPTPTSSIPQPTNTQEATAKPLPSATSTQPVSPTEISTNAETATPTVELAAEPATATPPPAPEATLDISRSLPPWILEPEANILLLGSQEDQTITLLNADSGELYTAAAPAYEMQPQWFWNDGNYYLNAGASGRKFLDLVTSEYVTIPAEGPDIVSPNGRYAARIEKREDRSELVKIIDYELETEVELANPFRDYQTRDETFNEYVQVYWSPDGAFLAVVYFKHYYSDNEDRNLAIYTPSGELFRQNTSLTPELSKPWNPIRPYRILYYGRRSPCILEVVDNEQTCLSVIAEWAEQQVVVPTFYTWSPDGEKISFVHSSDRPNTGLCYYEVATEELVCPITTEDLFFGRQFFARKHYWSPDGKFLVLFFDRLGIIDVVGTVKVAIVNIETGDIQFIDGDYSFPFDDPWRPTIP